jgi:hypothetical protein
MVEDDDGVTIHGLVHPRTQAEAAQEMERLGISGSLHARSRFEKGPKFKEVMLRDLRADKKHQILDRANSITDLRLIRKLIDLGVSLAPEIVAFLDYAEAKLAWCDTATAEQIEAYDPALDSDWPSI